MTDQLARETVNWWELDKRSDRIKRTEQGQRLIELAAGLLCAVASAAVSARQQGRRVLAMELRHALMRMEAAVLDDVDRMIQERGNVVDMKAYRGSK